MDLTDLSAGVDPGPSPDPIYEQSERPMSEPIWDKDLGLWVYNDMPLTELESRAFDGGRSSISYAPGTRSGSEAAWLLSGKPPYAGLLDGPCRDRTCDLGIRGHRASFRAAHGWPPSP